MITLIITYLHPKVKARSAVLCPITLTCHLTGAYPSWAFGLIGNYKTSLKTLAKNKQSSKYCPIVKEEE